MLYSVRKSFLYRTVVSFSNPGGLIAIGYYYFFLSIFWTFNSGGIKSPHPTNDVSVLAGTGYKV